MATVTVVVLALGLLATYLTWTASRLDRLHVRTDLARAALDAQLLRRAAAALELAAVTGDRDLAAAAHAAHIAPAAERAQAESVLSEALRRCAPTREQTEVHEAARRVVIARRFHNEAVRDTRRFRRRRVVRVLRLSGSATEPQFFDLDDEPPADGAPAPVAPAGSGLPGSTGAGAPGHAEPDSTAEAAIGT